MSKYIELTQNQVALIDDWRYKEINSHKWQAKWDKKKKSFYATRSLPKDPSGKRVTVLMHAVIARTPKGMNTDHVDRDTLNNQEHNLRVCTHSQNLSNRGKTSKNTSGYKGVFKRRGGWIAQIKASGKIIYLGKFNTPEGAAEAYDKESKNRHGEFAVLNLS